MSIKEIKNAVSFSNNEIEILSKQLIETIISGRITELKKKMAETTDKEQLKAMTKKISILQQPYDQNFYLNIEKAATRKLTDMAVSLCNDINLNLINAEYFDFTGRLK